MRISWKQFLSDLESSDFYIFQWWTCWINHLELLLQVCVLVAMILDFQKTLVLAMGLGLGNAVGAVEGFGILSMASIGPIIAVLSMGLIIRFRQSRGTPATPTHSK